MIPNNLAFALIDHNHTLCLQVKQVMDLKEVAIPVTYSVFDVTLLGYISRTNIYQRLKYKIQGFTEKCDK